MVRPLLYLACVSLLIAGCNGAPGPLNQGAGSSVNGVRRDFDYCTGSTPE
ncbi:MAG: hypothetical protein WBV67_15630 [Candidatus Cybelea sp.]